MTTTPTPGDLSARLKDAVAYSHNFATAKPDIGATEQEHILGLCALADEAIAALSALPAGGEPVPEWVIKAINSADAMLDESGYARTDLRAARDFLAGNALARTKADQEWHDWQSTLRRLIGDRTEKLHLAADVQADETGVRLDNCRFVNKRPVGFVHMGRYVESCDATAEHDGWQPVWTSTPPADADVGTQGDEWNAAVVAAIQLDIDDYGKAEIRQNEFDAIRRLAAPAAGKGVDDGSWLNEAVKLLCELTGEDSPTDDVRIDHMCDVSRRIAGLAAPHSTVADLRAMDWPVDGRFTVRDMPSEHDPCYLVMPGGEMLALAHHAKNGVDQARAQFVADACNAALTRQPVAGDGVNGRAWKVGDRVIWTSRFGKPFAGTVTCVRDPIPVRYEVELDDGALCDPLGHELTAAPAATPTDGGEGS